MSALIKNAVVLTLDPPGVEPCDIRIVDGEIVDRGKHLRHVRGEEVVDLGGKFVMPGFVNAHTHLYSALSRGMPSPKTPPKDFVEILQKVWWKLDEALDDEAIYYSALVGAIEAAKFGTTTLIDHHASPNAIPGSLDYIKDALMKVGLRGILCYETTDRGGMKRRDLGLQENERFVMENANHRLFRGTIGAHASFTLSDDSLRQLGDLASIHDTGVHIHVAEDMADVLDARNKRGIGLVNRLEKFGVLRRKSIFAHGVHLTNKHLARIEETGAWMVHNPRSNMNNAVGYAPLRCFGKRSALGTDGFPADMFEESKFGFFRNAESDRRIPFIRWRQLLQNGNGVASQSFGQTFGTLRKGSPADLVVLDYTPPTPLTTGNLLGHFLFGMNSSMVHHVMANGNWIVWNKQVMTLDEEVAMARARAVAKKLWGKLSR